MSDVFTDTPVVVRRLDTPAARTVADLAGIFEDLQTVLRCCERLVAELAAPERQDEVVLEALWTTALLSYGRCFATRVSKTGLTSDDVVATGLGGDVAGWHRILLQLRDHQADPATNPRERFTVGVSQGEDGAAAGIAVTSARQPAVDELTVRQTGAIAFALSRIVDQRITTGQEAVSGAASAMSRDELGDLPVVELAAAPG